MKNKIRTAARMHSIKKFLRGDREVHLTSRFEFLYVAQTQSCSLHLDYALKIEPQTFGVIRK